jgi:DNA-binding LacI/PurR family transcriptional regulator
MPQQKRPTLADVAAAAGVSKAAASRVVNDAPGVAPETRAHVRRVIERLGWRPDPAARALASGHGDVIELVVVDDPSCFSDNPYYGRVTAGVLLELAGGHAQLRVHVIEEARAAALLSTLADTVSLGALLLNVSPAMAAAFHARCDRVVTMGPSAPGVPYVDMENAAGTAMAVRHLHETGRRRIAAVHGQEGNPDADARREGYARAVRDLGRPDISAIGKFNPEQGYELTQRLLAADPSIDAIVAANDQMATGVVRALTHLGRRIPQDVAVVGFDNCILASRLTPALTSVHQPVEEMAAAATRALINRQVAPHWRLVFPAALRIRESSH